MIALALVVISNVDGSNFNKPHTHTGKLDLFEPGDPKVKLDGKALGILKAGKPYSVRMLLIWIVMHFVECSSCNILREYIMCPSRRVTQHPP